MAGNRFTFTGGQGLPPTVSGAFKTLQAILSLFRRDPDGGYALDGSFIQLDALAADPPAPSAGRVRIYAKLVGGKVKAYALFPTGAAQNFASEP